MDEQAKKYEEHLNRLAAAIDKIDEQHNQATEIKEDGSWRGKGSSDAAIDPQLQKQWDKAQEKLGADATPEEVADETTKSIVGDGIMSKEEFEDFADSVRNACNPDTRKNYTIKIPIKGALCGVTEREFPVHWRIAFLIQDMYKQLERLTERCPTYKGYAYDIEFWNGDETRLECNSAVKSITLAEDYCW